MTKPGPMSEHFAREEAAKRVHRTLQDAEKQVDPARFAIATLDMWRQEQAELPTSDTGRFCPGETVMSPFPLTSFDRHVLTLAIIALSLQMEKRGWLTPRPE
jgi:hypothetical protein